MEGGSFQILETKRKNFVITGCPRISRHQFHIWNFFPSFEMALGLTIFRYQGIFLQPKSTPCGTALKLWIIYIMSKTYHILHFQIFPCHIYLYEAFPCLFKLALVFQSGVGWKHQDWPAYKKGCSSPEIVKIKKLSFFSFWPFCLVKPKLACPQERLFQIQERNCVDFKCIFTSYFCLVKPTLLACMKDFSGKEAVQTF